MKGTILEYIRKNDEVSYAEIEWLFEKNGYNYKGNVGIYSDVNDNVIFWQGWSKQAFKILSELMKDNLIERIPCEALIYLIDGKGLTYPVLHSYSNLKSVHWLPCVFKAVKH